METISTSTDGRGGEGIPGRGNSMCKDPETCTCRMGLTHLLCVEQSLCVRRGAVGVRVSCKGGLGPSHETPNVSLGSWDILVAVGSQRRFWSKSTVGSELQSMKINLPSE